MPGWYKYRTKKYEHANLTLLQNEHNGESRLLSILGLKYTNVLEIYSRIQHLQSKERQIAQ